jgi:hypothetical protein
MLLSACSNTPEKECVNLMPDPKDGLCRAFEHLEKPMDFCKLKIESGDINQSAKLRVEQGEEYIVSYINYQNKSAECKINEKSICNRWCDATRVNYSLCGEEGSTIMNLVSPIKRDSLWFSVIAEVIIDDPNKEPLIRKSQYDLCNTPKFAVSTTGTLQMYPNDAQGFYGNNHGHLWVEVKRLK